MENKKLLKYLLKDLGELDEMFSEKGKNCFDDIEMEFIQNRVSGATKLVQMFLGKENNIPVDVKTTVVTLQNDEIQNSNLPDNKMESKVESKNQEIIPAVKTPGIWVEESATEVVVQETKIEEKVAEPIVEEEVVVVENKFVDTKVVQVAEDKLQEQVVSETSIQTNVIKHDFSRKELQLEDEAPIDIHNKRLGDSFLKEKSVNDLMSDDLSKLEHKLSNRPISSIQAAIGINDRFQYIRELFEGRTDNFVKTVSDLDSLNDIKEAVDYLQSNFKWKKNESSLKFVNLIKRRFPNE